MLLSYNVALFQNCLSHVFLASFGLVKGSSRGSFCIEPLNFVKLASKKKIVH